MSDIVDGMSFCSLENICVADGTMKPLICLICLKNTSAISNSMIDNADTERLSLFNICSVLLRYELDAEVIDMWNSSKILSFCEKCENMLRSYSLLCDQLLSIKTSIMKIRTDTKIQLITSQQLFPSSEILKKNDSVILKRFLEVAFKDFSPKLELVNCISEERGSAVDNKNRRRLTKGKRGLSDRKVKLNINKSTETARNQRIASQERADSSANGNEKTRLSKKESTEFQSEIDIEMKIEIDDHFEEINHENGNHSDPDFYFPSSPTIENNLAEKTEATNQKSKPKVKRRNRRKSSKEKTSFPLPDPNIKKPEYVFRSVKYFYNDTDDTFKCGLCDKIRKRHLNMRSHIASYHPVEGYGKWSYDGVSYSLDKESGRLKCSLCNKILKTRNAMIKHIKGWHNAEGKVLTGKGMEYKNKLLANPPKELEDGKLLHKGVEITKDTVTGKYHCGTCGRIRISKNSMILHIAEVHDEEGKKENQCQQCQRCFGTSHQLKIHMKIHLETMAYQCEQCGMGFRQGSNMYRHIARVHKQIRPYVCEYCNKSFFSKKDCRVHVRVHTKERPYTCDVPDCGLGFSLLQSLQNHKTRVHASSADNFILAQPE